MKSLKRWMDFPRITLVIIQFPVSGVREIVHHLGDSESTSAFRFRKLLVHDNPVIEGYDEAKFADVLKYNERDMAPALEAFRLARVTTAQLFDLMSEDQWKRQGVHSSERSLFSGKVADHLRGPRPQSRRAIQRLKDTLNRSNHSPITIADF